MPDLLLLHTMLERGRKHKPALKRLPRAPYGLLASRVLEKQGGMLA